MVRAVGLYWIVAQPSMQWPQVCWSSFFGHWSFEQPDRCYTGYQWVWRSILPAPGPPHHKGSGRGSLGLWWRSSGSSCTRLHCFWISVPVTLGTPTIRWIIIIIKESEIDELSASLHGSRMAHLLACLMSGTFDYCRGYHTSYSGSDQLEGGSQNYKEGRSRCLFHQK